ncbi:hypothetical protein BBJ28_00004313 [Nothophytophthora sp. Chile5]|nr:hypothetical protein BBJ28_00004313 [Nothophytophthora sp. Chile5]
MSLASFAMRTQMLNLDSGFDYVGNDLANVKAISAGYCCDQCEFYAGCKAFTWSTYNNGTCWLKSGRGTVSQNRYVTSAVMSTEALNVCEFNNNIDFVGNDITSMPMDAAIGCCMQCRAMPGCRAYTYTDYKNGTCWFKSAKGRMVVKQGVISVDVYPPPVDAMCGLESGVDFVGNDIGSKPASNAKDCCAICEAWNGCRAFSWKAGTCYLKNLKGDTVKNAEVTSAAIFANPVAPSCALEVGVDYVDHDIGNKPSKDAYGCCSICMATSGCRAFSWTDHEGGTCWLKSAKGDSVKKDGVKSAVV